MRPPAVTTPGRDLLSRAPWHEMVDLVAAAAPHGFLIYFKNDVDPVVRLAALLEHLNLRVPGELLTGVS